MKKIGCILILLLTVCLTACSNQGQIQLPEDYIPTASENPFLVDTGYKKPEINLDGVLDDSKWDGLQEFTFGDEINASVKAFYGEGGIYVGAVINDTELWASSERVYDNTSFEVYLDYSGNGGAKPENDQVQIFIDVNEQSMVRRGNGGMWLDTSFIKNYAVKVNGTIGTKDANNNYVVELFIPYSQLGGEPLVDYGMGFGLVGCRNNVRELWRGAAGINVQSPETYLKFYRDTNSVEYTRKVNTSNLMIDGKADEDVWKDRLEYSFGDGGRGSVINYFDEKGCYFFFKMKDNAVCAEGNTVFLNDSIEIYLDALSDGGTKPQTDDLQIRVDANGNIEVLRGLGVGEWNNVVNNVFAGAVKKDGSYDVEVFVPWPDLSHETKPDSMRVSFGSVNWDGAVNDAGNRQISWSGTGLDPQIPDNYVKITGDGVEGATKPAAPAEVVLDGVLNDGKWNGTPTFTYHGGNVTVNWFWTNQGCYMGFTVADSNISTNGTKPFENSSIEVYLDYNNNAGKPDAQDRTILVDAAGNMLFRKGVNGAYLDFGTNKIQSCVSRTGNGYVVELYIPWVEFGGGRPESMGVAFGRVTLTPGKSGTEWFNDGLCADPQRPDLYSVFTAEKIGNVGAPVAESEITLDGDFSDSKWSGTPSYSYHNDSVTVNWFWTDLGCYMGFKVTDGNVVTSGAMPFQNSSIEVYIDYDHSGGDPGACDRTILVDAGGKMLFRKGVDGAYLDFGTSNILSGVKKADGGYNVELFIPWAEFGGSKPDVMGVAFGQVTVKADGTTAWHNDGLCPDPQDPEWYSGFSASTIG